jgi:hypothetical protein
MPLGLLNIPFTRATSGVPSALSAAYSVVNHNATAETVWFAGPVKLPDWVDVSRPIDIGFMLFGGGSPPVPGQQVSFQLRYMRVPLSGASFADVYSYDYTPPAIWLDPTPTPLIYIDGLVDPDHTYPANTFERGDSIGWRFSRRGNYVNDNYPNSVSVGAYLELWAYKRCQLLCC